MSVWREALLLPVLFLTVVLTGAMRPGAGIAIVPPSLASLLAAMIVLALLVRSGALDPHRLLNSGRSPLANLNGLTVVLSAFAASAQVVTMLVPESGVPALLTWVVLAALLAQALALAPDRARLLRGLMVSLGAVFALKFVILAAVSQPAEGRLARAVQLLFEGITLGSMAQRPAHAAEGYLAFLSIVLYLIGVALLPAASWRMVRINRKELPE
jgi:hypothetical protein